MPITMHPYSPTDRQRIIDFRRAYTTRENAYDYPTAADLHELLDASALQETTRASIWEDERGNIVAFAILALRYCNCYFLIAPETSSAEIARDILDWAEGQLRETESCPAIDTPCRDTDSERITLLERHGFVRQETQTLYMTRSLSEPIPPAVFPEGFILRQAAGEQELEAIVALHQAAFGTQNMTIETRRAIMRNPAYIPELDLLLQAPDGTLAAFCYCSIPEEANELSGRSEGEIAIMGTSPAYQKRGLGRAMLLAGLQRLKDCGVETATLGTSSENEGAHAIYFSVGFCVSYRSLWYSKNIR
jgi:ribosomal protein S18 acetylase RimI-like enzyme